MKNYLKNALIISLIFNIVLFSLIIYVKREGIIKKFNNYFKTTITDEQLKAFNNEFMPEFTDSCTNKVGKPLRILVIGNSLTTTGVDVKIGKNHNGGLVATSKGKDFVHSLLRKIENKLPKRNICLRITNFAHFERNLALFNFNSCDSLINYNPDIIIFQLGENVSDEEMRDTLLFKEKYIALINCFRKNASPLIICTNTFFPSLAKNKIIEKVAIATNIYMVDLSHLSLLDNENFAKDEKNYQGDKSLWYVDGIGIHPGDKGMENISNQLFITINASILRDEMANKQ